MENRFSRLAVNALFPRFCVHCGGEGGALCTTCKEAYWPPRRLAACPFCNQPGTGATCSTCQERNYLDGVVSLWPYADSTFREALLNWKYYGDMSYWRVIEHWLRALLPMQTWPCLAKQIVPLPLHKRRERWRGFNQADLIARTLAETFDWEINPCLTRVAATAGQAKTHSARREVGDLDYAFAAKGAIPNAVWLCDDVFTSGATLDAAARALKEAGALQVWGFTLAHG